MPASPLAGFVMLFAMLGAAASRGTSAVPAAENPAQPAASNQPRSPSATPAAAASPIPRRSPAPLSTLSAHDHAESLPGGTWQCETIAGGTGSHTYTANQDDGSIELQTTMHFASRRFAISEVYRFDGSRNVWTVEVGDGIYRGTAPPWDGPKWIFDGSSRMAGKVEPTRMVYFDLGADAFRRDFQSRQGDVWRTYSAETCTRPSN